MTTRQDQEAVVRAAAIKAHWVDKPDHEEKDLAISNRNRNYDGSLPIRLADVLLAVRNERPTTGRLMPVVLAWNLRADRLEDQSPECVAFLYELLS